MPEGLGQLMAFITLALILLLITRFLWRATPFGTWVPLPFPGRSLLRRAVAILLLLVLVGVLLDALTVEWGRDRERRLPVFVVDSKKTPEIAKHIRNALAQGQPRVLHRVSPAVREANRQAACGHWPRGSKLSCDEYPFASTYEGGRGASIAGVPRIEQRRQGGALRAFYAKERIRSGVGGGPGDPFLVVVK
jgi:hypothetical protein